MNDGSRVVKIATGLLIERLADRGGGHRVRPPRRRQVVVNNNGALGIEVEKAAEVEEAVRAALAHPGPALVDVMVNPDERPMPGKVSYDQAKGFAQAFLRGQPHKATIASTLFRDKLDQLRG
jgi:hypothetical protein